MVVHDRQQQPSDAPFRPTAQGGRPVKLAEYAKRTQTPEDTVSGNKKERRWRLSVVGVQCIACVVVLLLALLLRTAGGAAYEQLRQSFHESLMRNDLLATLSMLWDGDPLEDVVSQPSDTTGESTTTSTTGGTDGTTTSTDKTTSTTSTSTTTAPTTGTAQTTGATTKASGVSATGTAGGRLPPEGVLAVALRVNRVACAPVSQGSLTSGYGYRQDPTGEDEQFHRGVDIAAPAGTPIAAMFYGQVTAAGESDSLGQYIRLNHGDGVEVLYAHCSGVVAVQGAFVRPGETVALVGATGDATGSHVHVQISCDGQVYNPSAILPLSRYA